ncbi:MAG: prepilin peptidase [Acidobacteria bacterium]|nr:prepilin peptidase [Acidobacteriota bacterium]
MSLAAFDLGFHLAAFVVGLTIGSFLNVCIHRLPKGESIVHPRSRCPHCGRMIAAYDNVPVLSYLWLRGRCRHCHSRISPFYPLIELLTGLTFLLVYHRWGISPPAVKAVLLASALIVLTFTDLRERLLPDRITFPGIAAGFLFALWLPLEDGTAALLLRLLGGTNLPAVLLSVADALLGALLGAGLLFALGEIWYRLRRVEAMGLGDVKMMGMVGLFLGIKLTVLTLLLGSLLGSLLGGLFLLLAGKDTRYELPFGTFLGVAALIALFWGPQLVASYLSLFP